MAAEGQAVGALVCTGHSDYARRVKLIDIALAGASTSCIQIGVCGQMVMLPLPRGAVA